MPGLHPDLVFAPNGYLETPAREPSLWPSVCGDERPGAMMTLGRVPPGFLLIQNFLSDHVCARIVQECAGIVGERHTIFDPNAVGGGDAPVARSEARTSEFIDTRRLQTNIEEIVRYAWRQIIGPHYGKTIEWFELPEILRYGPGAEYKPHSDAEDWYGPERGWERDLDRDLSVLIYLNAEFTGGQLYFPNFQMQLPPQRGLLVAFPSDARYVHTALPVQTGNRLAIVSWAAVKGTPRVKDGPPKAAIRL